MPWCPECKAEYQEGYSICRDCQVDLVNELPVITKTVPETNDHCEAFLFTASDNIQADFIESLLRAYQIPVLKKYQGIGHYSQIYWGFTKFGVNLFVPAKSLADAQDIVRDYIEKPEDNGPENEDPETQSCYEKERKMRNWVVVLCYILSGYGSFFLLFYWFYKLGRKLNDTKASLVRT